MRGRSLVLALLSISAILSGCLGEEEPGDEQVVDDSEQMEDLPTFGPHSGLASERPSSWEPRLDERPEWALGEWWTYDITDHHTGEQFSVTRVVAGREGTDYLVGMPIDEFNDMIMILHFPGFGLVRSDSLGYEAHDFLFEPLQFPLDVDRVWKSLWQGGGTNSELTHLVASHDEEAKLAYMEAGGGQTITYTYDANLGEISQFDAPGYMSYTITDHGFDFEGIVRVPHNHDLIFFNGRIGPALDMSLNPQPLPTETITVSDTYDRSTFSLINFEVGALAGDNVPAAPASPGASRITTIAPDGTSYEQTKLPTENFNKIDSYSHDLPGGDWQLEIIAGGGHAVLLEGIGYVVFDVELPSGCVQLTERVHDHGGICGAHVHDIE